MATPAKKFVPPPLESEEKPAFTPPPLASEEGAGSAPQVKAEQPGFLSRAVEALNPIPALKSMAPDLGPKRDDETTGKYIARIGKESVMGFPGMRLLSGQVGQTGTRGAQALDAFSKGNVSEGIGRSLQAIPVIGQAAEMGEKAAGDLKAGNYSGAAGDLAPIALPLAAKYGWRGLSSTAGRIVPSMENAGKTFDVVMQKAGDVPLDLSKPGDAALRAHELATRGAALPKVIRDFTNAATKPQAPPMTYRVGRDFASNASRLSAQENAAMAGPMKRQVALFSKALNEANAGAAEQAGVRPLYDRAMREYRNAARIQGVKNTVLDIAKNKAVRAGAGALGAGYVAGRLLR